MCTTIEELRKTTEKHNMKYVDLLESYFSYWGHASEATIDWCKHTLDEFKIFENLGITCVRSGKFEIKHDNGEYTLHEF